jgi:hypothetical protein
MIVALNIARIFSGLGRGLAGRPERFERVAPGTGVGWPPWLAARRLLLAVLFA